MKKYFNITNLANLENLENRIEKKKLKGSAIVVGYLQKGDIDKNETVGS